MLTILDRLGKGEILVSDGAMGTLLQARGLRPGESPESWCVTHPGEVRSVAEAYLSAGADIVETNSFGGSVYKQRDFGLASEVDVFNKAAAQLPKGVVDGKCYVAASVGPTGQIVEDEGGEALPQDLYIAFQQQIIALAEGGADVICIETMTSRLEAALAIQAAKENTKLPVFCTFTFDRRPNGFRTMMGVTPAKAALAAVEAGADVVGANCGNGISDMIEIAREIRDAVPRTPIMIQANAGAPILVDGATVYRDTPAVMADRVPELIAAGANIIGGCCGTTPEHIAAIARAAKACRSEKEL